MVIGLSGTYFINHHFNAKRNELARQTLAKRSPQDKVGSYLEYMKDILKKSAENRLVWFQLKGIFDKRYSVMFFNN